MLRRRAGKCCKVGGILTVAVCGILAVLAYNSYTGFAKVIDEQIAAGYLRSHAGLYAAPRIVEKGARLTKEQLATTLQRAGYARDKASNVWNGSFEVSENSIRILPRDGTGTHEWINVNFDSHGHVATLLANDGSSLSSYSVEPELLTVDAALKTGQQETLTWQNIPPVMVQAILSIEDRRFFNHHGLDIRGIGRAIVSWATSGSVKFQQGGSTITQQLVKNTYLSPEKTLQRKFNEALIALALEQRLSKQDILALYCNEVYLGQRNGVGVRGVAQAARVFFGKDLKDISLAEAATIAGMIQSPARYAPDRHQEASKQRRDTVLAAMASDGALDAASAQTAIALPLEVAQFEGSSNELAPYYIDAVNRGLDEVQMGLENDGEPNLRILTTIDPDLQTAAENALRQQLELLGKSSRRKTKPQGAMVALDAHTGQVLAMVGGRSYEESQLNRATDAKRQPGSVFKPFVYAAALESGISPLATYRDAPQTFQYGSATYAPANYGRAYSMQDVTMREGLVRSLNVVTVELAMRSGLANVANTAARFGLPRPEVYPSLALGVSEATPLQMAAAYAVFANAGKAVRPSLIARVGQDTEREIVTEKDLSDSPQVIKPTTAFMINDMLSDVTKRGTARRANGSFKDVAIAGKTGTSHDGWFVGYTPNLVCAVWVGFDDNQQLGLTGAEAALPAWIDFMKEALSIRPSLGGDSFPIPRGVVTVKIDPETGYLAGPNCPSAQTVKVAAQFAPSLECLRHQPDEPALEYEAYVEDEPGLESGTSAKSNAESLSQAEGFSENKLATEVSGKRVSSEPKNISRPTLSETTIDVTKRGAPILVSTNRVANPGQPSAAAKRRP
ncbi:MAG: PBP1A family penicillin-binding protein [Pyrinomonadaceae bacterium]